MSLIKKVLLLLILFMPVYLYAAGKVNINTADKETLMTIKGVGEKRADAIIAYRESNGEFKSVEDLSKVSGVSTTIVDENRENLSVDE